MTRILLLIAALIVYGSLYPWQFAPVHFDGRAAAVFLHSWPKQIDSRDAADIFVNLFLYGPVGMFAFLALDRHGHRRLRWLLPVLLAGTLSCAMEWLQIFDRSRVCSLLDVLNNTLGGAIGMGLGWLFRRSMSGAILLVLYWLGYELCGLFDVLTRRRVTPPGLRSSIEVVTMIFAWMVVLRLLMTRADWPRKRQLDLALAAAFTLLNITRGLAPFHFKTSASRFNWLPFAAMFTSDWIVGLPVFLEKSFFYGAMIWLWRAAGLRFGLSTALVAGILAAVEAAQLYLPGRTAETTDPVLTVILGLILLLLEQDHRRFMPFAMIRVQA